MRILYVDDDRINTLLFQAACEELEGVELCCEEDSASALARVQAWQPDLLVLDYFLPGITGVALLGLLRRSPALAEVRAVLCSADVDDRLRQEAREAGFAGCWVKPVLAHTLRQDLEALPVSHAVSS